MDRAERDIRRKEGIICSDDAAGAPQARAASRPRRKRRIAAGAGVQVQEVNRLLNEFEQMQGMMKKMKGGGLMKMMKRMGGMGGLGGRAAALSRDAALALSRSPRRLATPSATRSARYSCGCVAASHASHR